MSRFLKRNGPHRARLGSRGDLPLRRAGSPPIPTPARRSYPDQVRSTRPTAPRNCAERINRTLKRADEIEHRGGGGVVPQRDWLAPIVADAEAGFGGPLNAL